MTTNQLTAMRHCAEATIGLIREKHGDEDAESFVAIVRREQPDWLWPKWLKGKVN